jgi:hypothetical protein
MLPVIFKLGLTFAGAGRACPAIIRRYLETPWVMIKT